MRKARHPLDSGTPLIDLAIVIRDLRRKLIADAVPLTFHDREQLVRILEALLENTAALGLLLDLERGERSGIHDGATIAIAYGIQRELEGKRRVAAAAKLVADDWSVKVSYVQAQWTKRQAAVLEHLDERYGDRGSTARAESLRSYYAKLRE